MENTLASRLRFVRGKESREKFANRIGVSPRALANYEYGEREPKGNVVAQICARLGIEANWLLSGVGPMYKNELVGKKISDCQRKIEPYSEQPIEKTSPTKIEKLRQSEILEVQRELMEALKQGMEFQKQVMTLTQENADLRVKTVMGAARIRELERENTEIPALKARIAELERELSERPKLPKTVPVDVSAKSKPTSAHGAGTDKAVVPGAGAGDPCAGSLGASVRGGE